MCHVPKTSLRGEKDTPTVSFLDDEVMVGLDPGLQCLFIANNNSNILTWQTRRNL